MKRFLRYILAAAVVMGFAACQHEEWAPGETDLVGCHGVFFSQQQAKDYVLAPKDASKAMSFTIERTRDKEEAVVPYEITSSVEGFFELEDDILFEKGQKKATFKVLIAGDYKLGETYECTIRVTDPQFVSQYSLSSSELSFSVSIVEWTRVKGADGSEFGIYRDDFFTSWGQQLGAELKQPNLEKEVAVYERADLPGYYRIDEVYTAEYISQIYAGDDSVAGELGDFCPAESIYINATNPEKVYIDAQFAFYDPFMELGPAYMCSDVEEVFTAGYSNSYGVMKNGVIDFPIKNSIIMYLPSAGGTALSNISGKTRLVFPGYRGFDYSVSLSYEQAEEGVLPVDFEIGLDVSKVDYQVFEGQLNSTEIKEKLEEVKKGDNVKTVTESGVYDFTAEKSGFYTLIACSYDEEGKFQSYDYIIFGYDTKEDPKDVDIHMGLIVSDRYTPTGLTAENSMEFYLYGTDIIKASAAIFKKVHYEDFKETIEYNVKNAPSYALDKYQLDSLNRVGYSGIVGNLTPGVEYCLLVYADNGYHSGFFTATATTEGVFDLMDAEFEVFDLPERLQPETHDAYLGSDWQVVSLDPYTAKEWGRANRGDVTIADKENIMYDENGKVTADEEKADVITDYLTLSGMNPTLAKMGLVDEIDLEFYDGFIYTLMTQMQSFKYDGVDVYPTNAYLCYSPDGKLYYDFDNGVMIGGFLTEDKDVIAFVPNPSAPKAISYGFSYFAMQLAYVKDSEYMKDIETFSSNAELFEEDAHAYPMLVKKGSKYADQPVTEESKLALRKACDAVSLELQKGRRNFVETESGYVKSTIDMVRNSMPRNFMQDVIRTDAARDVKAAEYTMTPSSEKVVVKFDGKVEITERTLR